MIKSDNEPYNMQDYIFRTRLNYGDMELYKGFLLKSIELEDALSKENRILFMQYNELEKLVMLDTVRAIRKDIFKELGFDVE